MIPAVNQNGFSKSFGVNWCSRTLNAEGLLLLKHDNCILFLIFLPTKRLTGITTSIYMALNINRLTKNPNNSPKASQKMAK